MKFVVHKQVLMGKLKTLAEVKVNNSLDELLKCIVLEPKENVLRLHATNLNTFLNLFVPIYNQQGEIAQKVAVEAKQFNKIINGLDDGEIYFEITDNKLIIAQDNVKYQMLLRNDVERYPIFEPNIDEKILKEVDGSELVAMIDNVMFCAAKQDAMRALNGALWDIENGTLRIVASDGYRLALVEKKMTEEVSAEFILSLDALKVLKKFLTLSNSYDVSFYDGNIAFVTQEGDIAIFKKIEEQYPDYKRVIPKQTNVSLTIKTAEFEKALKQIITTNFEKVLLTVKGSLKLHAHNSKTEVEIEIPIVEKQGNIEIAYNPKFLYEVLKKLGDTTTIQFIDETSPTKIANPEEGFLYIVLPVRV